MIRFNKQEQDFIKKLHLLSGYNIEDVREMFEAMITQIVFDYMEGKSTHLPLLGEIFFEYIGDEVKKGKKEAIIKVTFIPDDFLKKVIGQIQDGEENEIEKIFKHKIKSYLEKLTLY